MMTGLWIIQTNTIKQDQYLFESGSADAEIALYATPASLLIINTLRELHDFRQGCHRKAGNIGLCQNFQVPN